jgi:hypothetical protein
MKLKVGDIIKKEYDEGIVIGKIKELTLRPYDDEIDDYIWGKLEILECPKALRYRVKNGYIIVGYIEDKIALGVKKIEDDDELMVERL